MAWQLVNELFLRLPLLYSDSGFALKKQGPGLKKNCFNWIQIHHTALLGAGSGSGSGLGSLGLPELPVLPFPQGTAGTLPEGKEGSFSLKIERILSPSRYKGYFLHQDTEDTLSLSGFRWYSLPQSISVPQYALSLSLYIYIIL